MTSSSTIGNGSTATGYFTRGDVTQNSVGAAETAHIHGDRNVSATVLTDTQRAVIGTFVSMVVVFIMVGNALTLLSFITHRRLRRRKYIPVASLAVADIFVGLSAVLILCNRFAVEKSPGDSQIVELALMLVIYQSISASGYHLIVLAIDRFVAVRFPMHYRHTMTAVRISMMTACCWVLSLLTTAPYLVWLSPERRRATNRRETCYQFEGRRGPVPLYFDYPIRLSMWIFISISVIGLTLIVCIVARSKRITNEENGLRVANRLHYAMGMTIS